MKRPTPIELQQTFDVNVEAVRPLLYSLGSQIVDASAERQWDLLIGDDTAGRLLTGFVRKILAHQGLQIPTAYVCTSMETRQKVSQADYLTYLTYIADKNDKPQKTLFVSEVIGTGNTARHIGALLGQVFPENDFAFLGSRYHDPEGLQADHMYIGGRGRQQTQLASTAFEDIISPDTPGGRRSRLAKRLLPEPMCLALGRMFPQSAVRASSSYPSNNLIPGTTGPVAELSPDATYRQFASHCYTRMGELALDFTEYYLDSESAK